jgi:hypothetical protein
MPKMGSTSANKIHQQRRRKKVKGEPQEVQEQKREAKQRKDND